MLLLHFIVLHFIVIKCNINMNESENIRSRFHFFFLSSFVLHIFC